MATTQMVREILQLTKYNVVSALGVETTRTDKKAAEADVHIFKDIIRRHTWIEES